MRMCEVTEHIVVMCRWGCLIKFMLVICLLELIWGYSLSACLHPSTPRGSASSGSHQQVLISRNNQLTLSVRV